MRVDGVCGGLVEGCADLFWEIDELGIPFFIPSAPFPPKARGRRGVGALLKSFRIEMNPERHADFWILWREYTFLKDSCLTFTRNLR